MYASQTLEKFQKGIFISKPGPHQKKFQRGELDKNRIGQKNQWETFTLTLPKKVEIGKKNEKDEKGKTCVEWGLD